MADQPSRDRLPRTTDELLHAVRGTPYEALLRDEAALDRKMWDLLSQSRDPVAREVGRGLSDGSLTTRQLADSDVYADFVHGGLEAASRLDPRGVLGEVEEERAAEEERERRPGAAGRRGREE